jgi:hypothetical protein
VLEEGGYEISEEGFAVRGFAGEVAVFHVTARHGGQMSLSNTIKKERVVRGDGRARTINARLDCRGAEKRRGRSANGCSALVVRRPAEKSLMTKIRARRFARAVLARVASTRLGPFKRPCHFLLRSFPFIPPPHAQYP